MTEVKRKQLKCMSTSYLYYVSKTYGKTKEKENIEENELVV